MLLGKFPFIAIKVLRTGKAGKAKIAESNLRWCNSCTIEIVRYRRISNGMTVLFTGVMVAADGGSSFFYDEIKIV